MGLARGAGGLPVLHQQGLVQRGDEPKQVLDRAGRLDDLDVAVPTWRLAQLDQGNGHRPRPGPGHAS